ncbi:hypothetical protein EJV47_18890 [Hymenobacter gummosus]|uniref:Uncharacterized protein n=1 Tax=Hymenobacter gummosus TaxID=1776032 RepID=A0A3S0JEZ8_9BACT|nr:hypothetical protein [Hymenobacter gummosus]RTQ47492.1 hypothetical protein EJV47_18890 [Hymenobacter gummosus]
MRQLVAWLLLLSLSVHCAGRLGIVASWWLNRDYVARVLCINRAKPQMRCNGKCHLRKQLQAADAREAKQQPGSSKQAFQEIVLACPGLPTGAPQEPAWFADAPPRYAELRVPVYAWIGPGLDHPPLRG